MADVEQAPQPPETLLDKARRLGVHDKFTVSSRVCPVKLQEVLNGGLMRGHEKAALKELAKRAKRDGIFTVDLKEKRTKCGRAYSSDYSVASAITMRSDVRGVLYSSAWSELDIVACHPSILKSFALQRGIPVPVVTEYLANRKAWLEGTAKAFSISEVDAKLFFNAAIYGSRMQAKLGWDNVERRIHESWADDLDGEVHRARLSSFIAEVRSVGEQLLADKEIQKEHRVNLRRADRSSSKLFKLLEARPHPKQSPEGLTNYCWSAPKRLGSASPSTPSC